MKHNYNRKGTVNRDVSSKTRSSSDSKIEVDDQPRSVSPVVGGVHFSRKWCASARGVESKALAKGGGITRLNSGGSESGVLPGIGPGCGAGGALGNGALWMRTLWAPRSPWPLARPHSTASVAMISRAI